MSNQVSVPPPGEREELNLLLRTRIDGGLWSSLKANFKDTFFPEKLPPLQLTSRPVRVREIWGDYNYRKPGSYLSGTLHVLLIGGIIAATLAGAKVVKEQERPKESVTLIAPDLSEILQPSKKQGDMGGGGGGGDRDKIEAPKGKLPKTAMQQFTPPAMVVRNDHPKLPMEPTVVVPPEVKIASAMPNLGDPMAKIPSGPPSNGIGSGGGIGSGSGGGVGSGEGPGVGPGKGGGIGGGVFRVGGGVSAPRALSTPDPEYSEEARKAKFQGNCTLWLVVGSDGNPRDVRVLRSLGMGLDEKATEAVRHWKFAPAMKDGKPVAVQINVEVSFRLY